MRGGRGRGGFEGTRGGRGRGADRGRGGFRGARGGHATVTDGITTKETATVSVPTTESSAWDIPVPAETANASAWDTSAPAPAATENNNNNNNDQGAWGSVVASESTPAAAPEGIKSAVVSDSGAKKTWASMFAKPKPAPAPVVPKQLAVPPPPVPAEPAKAEEAPAAEEIVQPEAEVQQQPEDATPAPAAEEEVVPTPVVLETPAPDVEPLDVSSPAAEVTDSSSLAPTHAPLTEDNLENLPDVSHPPATLTAASTAGSADPRGVTPQAPIGRPPVGGFQTSAYRAAATPGRSASYQRRVLEQQEAVVMPGHNAVDRAAVQFGSLGLNGDAVNLDVDDEREEAETRTQPPQQSPPSQPRASLPPAPRQAPGLTQDHSVPENLPTPRQAPGLPPPPQQGYPTQDASSLSSLPQDSTQAYSQYARYGQQPETSSQAQKPFDPFSHQAPSSAFDQYASQPSAQQHQQGFGAFSSAPSDYSHYYTADQQRNAYNNYYGASYGQQNTQSQDASSMQQQRSNSGFGSAPGDSAFSSTQAPQQVRSSIPPDSSLFPQYFAGSGARAASGLPEATAPLASRDRLDDPQTNPSKENYALDSRSPYYNQLSPSDHMAQSQSRYGDAQGSGHNTPNPSMSSQPQAAAPAQQMHQAQLQTAYPGYPYGHPYYSSPYHAAYQNQFGFQGLGGYGAPYGGKGGMYAQSQGFGMNPPSSYESSPAHAAGFGQTSIQSRDSALGSGLGDYGRTAAQPSQLSSSGFGGISEPFGRAQSGFQGQSQGYGQQQSMQQAGASDDLKPFGEAKAGGPSPALGQPGRPGSATNSIGGQAPSSTLPPPQSHQQGFGGYPGFGSQGSQYGLGGLGGSGHQQQQQQQQHQQQHQQGAYGGYSGFGNTYGNAYGRGGWGGNYQGH